eukprot:184707-Amphidinium_carterae.1
MIDDLKKQIATFELLACTMLIRMAIEVCGATGSHMELKLRGINDNQGVVFALLKQYSRKMPMAAVHMEMVAT